MAATTINIRTDNEVKAQAQEVLSQLGLDLTTAINLFLRQVICKQSVSFDVSVAPLSKNAKRRLGFIDVPPLPDSFFEPLPGEEIQAWEQ